jgi:hypothetical protein
VALDDPYDPYAPQAPVAPWSWVPDEWNSVAPAAPVEAPAPAEIEMPAMQMADIEMPAMQMGQPEPEIEMPPMDVGQPTIGFPREPIDAEPLFPPPPGAPTLSALTSFVTDPVTGAPDAIANQNRGPASMPFLNEAEPPSPFGAQLTPEQRARQFAAGSPEEQARQEYAWNQGRDAEISEQIRAARLNDEQKQLENESAIKKLRVDSRAAMVKVDEDSKAAAAEQVDGDRWWNSRSTGQKIAGFISAIVGGLVQGRSGGPNQGLAMIEAEIDRDVDVQKFNMQAKRAELQRRGASIQQLAAFDQESFLEAEKFRLAGLSRVMGTIAADAQNYDPQGKSAITLGKLYSAIGDARQKGLIAFEDQHFKNNLEVLKANADLAKTGAEIAKLEAEAAKLRGAIGGGAKAVKPEDVPQDPSYFEQRGLTRPPVTMSEKQYRAWQPLKKGTQEIAANESGISKEERENSIPGIKNPDGSTFTAVGRPEDVSKLRAQIAAGRRMIRRMDDAIRTRTGWSSNLGNSDERKKLGVQWGHVKLDAKELFDLGAITESDVPLVEGGVGTDDPSSWKDPTAGILEARRLVADRLNTALHAAGWDESQRFEPPVPSAKPPDETSDDRALKKAQDKNVGSFTTFVAEEDEVNPADRGPKKSLNQQTADHEATGGVPPSIRKQIEKWTVDARSGDEVKSKQARAYLIELTTTGGNDTVKGLAQLALTQANTPGTETVGPERSVAFETLPPLPPPKKKGKR